MDLVSIYLLINVWTMLLILNVGANVAQITYP